MRSRGVKVLDPVIDMAQIDWLVVPTQQCRSNEEEWELISSHFRRPHEAWGPSRAFVRPVDVRRGRNRVLFLQQSGLE
ncbi:MAG: hypothetical protein ABFC96_08705 [Thermoguttaceae bacterium]